MDVRALKEQIEDLDPKAHKSLIDALTAEYNRLAGEEGEAQKVESKGEFTSNPFAEMFEKTVDKLNSRYVKGVIDYLRKHHKDLYQKSDQLDERLNEVWEAGLKGNATVEEFREVLRKWYFVNIQGIEIYKKECQKNTNNQIKKATGS